MNPIESLKQVDVIYDAILRMYRTGKAPEKKEACKAARELLQQILDSDDGEHFIGLVMAMKAQNTADIINLEGHKGPMATELRKRLKENEARRQKSRTKQGKK